MGTPSSLLLGLGRNYGNVEYVAPSLWGAGILFAIAMIIPFLTFVNGICLIYLQVSQGLDVQETEQKLKAHVQQIKSRVNEAKEQANTKLQEAKESMRKAAIPEAAATEMPDHTQPQHRHCSHCQTRLSKDDIFCGECGTKNPIA
jgi:Zn finger protein HypA/HybF involved in hydrogenase expression